MIDLPQTPPAAYEQVLERKLVDCGLRRGAFTVSYEDELQSVLVVIGEGAGAGVETLNCIQRAAGREIVSFDDHGLQAAYDARVFDAHRDAILGDARREVEKHGLLEAFPERSAFGSDKLFAEAIERHCGMMPGAYKRALQRGDFLPGGKLGPETPSKTQISCLMAAISYAFARGDSFESVSSAMRRSRRGEGTGPPRQSRVVGRRCGAAGRARLGLALASLNR